MIHKKSQELGLINNQLDVAMPLEASVLPLIVYGEGVDPNDSINPEAAALTMKELGISDQAIGDAAIYLDPENRMVNYGTHYSPRQAQLRFRSIPELSNVKGEVVRLSANMRGKALTEQQMNRTLVHELEHVAQHDRDDSKVTTGHIAIWGLAAAGAVIGSRYGKSNLVKTAGTVLGAFLGYEFGYLIAPHERQARQRGRSVTSTAVRRGPQA